jgi:hypothetical protein
MARTGRFGLTSLAAGALQISGTLLLLVLPPAGDRTWILVGYLLTSAGTGFGGPTFMIAYQNALDRRQLGAGAGLFSLCRQFGASVGTALAGAIVGAGVSQGDVGSVIQQAFWLPAVAAAFVMLAAIMLPKRPLSTTHHGTPGDSVPSGQKRAPTVQTLEV